MDRTKKIDLLYVDDEEQNLLSFSAAFRRQYNVHTAMSGKEALNILSNNNVHVLITDQRMPEMTGLELLDKVSTQFPDVIKLILTGYSDIETIIAAINNGNVFRYLTKPWNINELRAAIEQAEELFSLKQSNKTLITSLNQKVEELEHTLTVFRKYVPENILKQTLDEPSEHHLAQGEQISATVLFCDIRKFTKMCEGKSPTEIVLFLNTYYEIMSECVSRYSGYVHQFVGDEIFALFGFPQHSREHEMNAVKCAIAMMKKLNELNQKVNAKIEIGIGIHAGELISGNIGTQTKLAHAITGETVNIGKRIEHQTKDLPNTILISENIYSTINQMIPAELWREVLLKGKSTPIKLYKVNF